MRINRFRIRSGRVRTLAVAAAVLKMAQVGHAQVVTYSALDLIIKRQSLLTPYALNNNDQVVGDTYSNSNGNSLVPFIFTPSTVGSTRAMQISNGTFSAVTGVTASSNSIATGINNAGLVVGVDGNTNKGFVYTAGSTTAATEVSPLNAGGSLGFTGVNNNGLVVGTGTNGSGFNTAVVYNRSNASLTDVGAGFTASSNSSYGIAVNDSNTILAIGAPPAATNSYGPHFQPFTAKGAAGGGFTYTNVGNAVEAAIPPYPGNYPAYGLTNPGIGIDSAGNVAGITGYSSANTYRPFINGIQGYLYNGGTGAVTDIGGNTEIEAVATVNGSTELAGSAYVYNPQTFGHEFDAFTQINGNFVNIATAVPGYTLNNVVAVNNNGDLIASGFNNSTGSAYTRYLLLVANPVPSLTYTGAVSNVWNTTAANFSPSNYSDGSFVTFDDTATGSTTVTIPSVVTPGGVTFNNSSKNYVVGGAAIAGGNTVGLTLKGTGAVTLNDANTFTGTTLVNNNGNLVIGPTGSLASPTLTLLRTASVTVQGGGTITSPAVVLSMGVGSSLTFAPSATAGRVALQTSTFTNYGGVLDLGNGDMIMHNSSSDNVFSELAHQYTAGIISSVAQSSTSHLTTLGEIQNSNDQTTTGSPMYATFDGVPVVDTDVLIKYTYFGDANLDGKVDGSDYTLIDNGFANEQVDQTLSQGWYNGDFNYDGVVDGSDYTLIDNAFNNQGAAFPTALVAAVTSRAASTTTAVPEPAGLGLGLIVLSVVKRRPSKTTANRG